MERELTEQDENANFKGLVQGISSDERQTLLNKIQKENQNAESTNTASIIQNEYENMDSSQILRAKLNQEPILHRFILWLKALFSSTTIEDAYNKSLLTLLARETDRNHPGLIDPLTHNFESLFYDLLSPLKSAQNMLAPYMQAYETNPGSFYVLLGNLIMPDVNERIRKEADPYIYPTDKELSKETRGNLIHRMNAILDSIAADRKAEMYSNVKYVEWLRLFCRLDLSSVLESFGSGDRGKSCPYIQLRGDFDSLANILSGHRSFSEDMLIAIHQFAEKERLYEAMGKEPVLRADFIEKASAELSLVGTFIDDVPMENLAKLVYSNSQYSIAPVGGGENWFAKFKAQWKSLFDHRWEEWNRELKKHQLREKIENYFDIKVIPVFKNRPWTHLWGTGVEFSKEYTLGFLAVFFSDRYDKEAQVLKTISLEGEFAIKENRMEFTDILNVFSEIKDDLDLLEEQLSTSGDIGQEFEKCTSRGIGSQTAKTRSKELLEELSERVTKLVNSFGKSCRILENLMSGIFSEKITAYYGPLLNMVKIGGRGNKKFMDELQSCRYAFEHAYEIIKDLEALEIPLA